MKNILMIITLSVFSFTVKAQMFPNVYLDNYLIPMDKKGVAVGKVLTRAPFHKIKISRDTSRMFVVDKQGIILLKKNREVKLSDPVFRYGIELSAGGQIYPVELVRDGFIKNGVIAHRGAWLRSKVMQNSIRSFENAVKLGCEGSEFDVWLTKDNVVVLCHDPVIAGLRIEESTLKELQDTTRGSGDMIPTLEEFLKLAKEQNRTRLFLEIKDSGKGLARTLQLTDSVMNRIHREKMQAWMEYISFNYDVLKRIHKIDPMAKIAFLEGNKSVDELRRDGITGIDFSFYYFRNDPGLIEKARKAGLSVNVWTVDDPDDLRFYQDKKLDYITTNEPEMLLEIIAKSSL